MFRYNAPLDPDCSVASEYERTLFEDPMTDAMGAPTDDIMEAFTRRHRRECAQCKEYGVTNIEVVS